MSTVQSRRTKYLTLLLILVGSGLAFLSSTQTWFSLRLAAVAGHLTTVNVSGANAAPALTALALAGLALVAAFALGGRVIRVFLAVVGMTLGGLVVVSVVSVLADPIAACTSSITAATGIAGEHSVRLLVTEKTGSVWPWSAIAGGVIIFAASLWALIRFRRWPETSRKYQVRFVSVDDSSDGEKRIDDNAQAHEPRSLSRESAIDSWDDLSRGDDPTR